MKSSVVVLCLIGFMANGSYGQDQAAGSPITLEELNRRQVVGHLGLPLGTAVEIDAEIVSGSRLGRKGYESLYLLRVTRVNGQELKASRVMRFSSPEFASVDLASDMFALYEMRRGTKAKTLDSSQIAELEEGYVGRKLRLNVYETGSFGGIPHQLPKDMPTWTDEEFRFATELIILKQ